MTDVSASVERFVSRHIEPGDGEIYTWDVWHGYKLSTNDNETVPKERFKWHLEQAMPDSAERDGELFSGVEYEFP